MVELVNLKRKLSNIFGQSTNLSLQDQIISFSNNQGKSDVEDDLKELKQKIANKLQSSENNEESK